MRREAAHVDEYNRTRNRNTYSRQNHVELVEGRRADQIRRGSYVFVSLRGSRMQCPSGDTLLWDRLWTGQAWPSRLESFQS